MVKVGDVEVEFSKCKVCGEPQDQLRLYRRPGTLQNQTPRPVQYYTCAKGHRSSPYD